MAEATLTLDGELDRQMKALRKGEAETIVCPWCGTFCNSETGECCVELADAKTRLARAHLQSIERQVNGIRKKLRDTSVQCPYCDGINRPENLMSEAHWKRPNISPYCCDLFFVAVASLAEREIVQEQLDHKRRIEDNISKAGMN